MSLNKNEWKGYKIMFENGSQIRGVMKVVNIWADGDLQCLELLRMDGQALRLILNHVNVIFIEDIFNDMPEECIHIRNTEEATEWFRKNQAQKG